MLRLFLATTIAFVTIAAASAQTAKVVTEDLFVPHGDGVKVFVRNKRPAGVEKFATDRIAIMMHGATYPSTAFDLALEGKSWETQISSR